MADYTVSTDNETELILTWLAGKGAGDKNTMAQGVFTEVLMAYRPQYKSSLTSDVVDKFTKLPEGEAKTKILADIDAAIAAAEVKEIEAGPVVEPEVVQP